MCHTVIFVYPKQKFNSEQDIHALGTQSKRIQYPICYNRNGKGHRCPHRATFILLGESQNCHLDWLLMGKEILSSQKEREEDSRPKR